MRGVDDPIYLLAAEEKALSLNDCDEALGEENCAGNNCLDGTTFVYLS